MSISKTKVPQVIVTIVITIDSCYINKKPDDSINPNKIMNGLPPTIDNPIGNASLIHQKAIKNAMAAV